jgi:arginase
VDSVNIFFPQWQAGAHRERIQLGAKKLHEMLEPRARFQTVTVQEKLELPISDDVKGKSDLLTHSYVLRTMLEMGRPENLFVLGGDCGISLLPITYLNARVESSVESSGEKMAVVWLDAHADINTPASSPSKHFHGMVLRAALGEGDANMLELAFKPIRSDQVILVGARDLDAPESEFVTAQKIKQFSSEEVNDSSLGVLEHLRNGGFSSVYIHLDFDAFEPSEIAFTRFPTPGGLRIQTVANLLEQIRTEFKLIGCALTECSPRDEAHWQSDHHKLEPILAALPIT